MKFSEMNEKDMENLMSGVKVGKGNKGGGRKEEVLNILKEGIYSIKELSGMVGVSSRNICSVVCYLRDDGMNVRKLNRGNDIGLVLWSKIVGGEKIGNRIEVGKEGKVVRYNFEKGCFEDEIVEEKKVVKKEVKKEVVKK